MTLFSLRSALRRMLPQGGGLSAETWWSRHRGILILLWIHAIIIPAYALLRGFSVSHSLLVGLIVPAAAGTATLAVLHRPIRTAAAALGLLSASAVLVHLSGGLIEMHFHFFVMLAVVALYQDWVPLLAAFVYVLVYHGVMGALDPASVFNHSAAISHPWKWATIHTFFVAGISGALLVHWKLSETHLSQRKAAEEQARREARLVATLNEVGQGLTADLELSQVIQRVTELGTELTSAQFGALFYNVDDRNGGGSSMLYTLSGAPEKAFSSLQLPSNSPVFDPTFAGRGPVRLADVRQDSRSGQVGLLFGMPEGDLPVRSYLAVPVVSRGKVLGGLSFGHQQPERFTDEAERLVIGLAAHAAAAIENAMLFESERRAHTRVSVLAEASRVLGKSLELDSILQEFAGLVVPHLADTFVADVVGEDGSLRRVALLADRRFVDSAWETNAGPPDRNNQTNPITRAIETGRSELIENAAGFPLHAAAADASYQEVLRRIDPATAVVVPLVHRDRVVGVFSIGTVRASGRRLRQEDLLLAEDLARRAAAAVENTTLYSRQRTAAETLQHALLPEILPDLPGLSTAARYVAGGPGVEVGGDWYDAVMLRDGSVALAMGDVVGHGVAAASLMGQLKSASRAHCLDHDPAEVLRRLNAMLHEFGPDDNMATLVYARFDPSTGVLRLANAGHPPPLMMAPDGTAAFFDEASGLPLGALARARYTEAVAEVEPGSTVVFYTDGLVEDRATSLDEGMDRLLAAAVSQRDVELEGLCDALLECTPHEPETSAGRDDVAILAFRWHSFTDALSLKLPARPSVLRPLRATLRRWLRDAGASEHEVFQILAATGEAVANVIRHAASGPSATFELQANRGDNVSLMIRDGGKWRDPAKETPGGHGLRIMAEFMDSLDIEKAPHGTVVRMRRRLTSPAGEIG